MTQPQVLITELDGALGVLPPSSGKLFALVGPSDSGPVNTPSTFAKVKDVVASFGGGPLVEAAAHSIERYGKPVVLVRTSASVLGAYLDAVAGSAGAIGSITKTGTGSSVFTDNSSAPTVGADVYVLFNVGGTRGVAGIVYQISLDGGNSYGPPQALGTGTTFGIGATGASIAIGAGTVVAGDFIHFVLTAPVPSSAGQLVLDMDGTSTPTIASGTHPNDDYEVFIAIVSGGTIGVAGITYKWSLDRGRTMSAETALGTAAYLIIPGSGGVRVNFGAGTLVAGDTIAFPTVAPCWNNTELGLALEALRSTAVSWELAEVIGPITADAFDVIDLKFAGMFAAGKYHAWLGSVRMPIGSESEANYLSSVNGAFSGKATVFGVLCAGADKMTSSVTGRKYRRPAAWVYAAREASVSEEINTADVNLGTLVGVSIRDANGNPDEHDESNNPGLDDARFTVLRSWDGIEGVYVNRPRLFSPTGSDFQLLPHRRVMNIAHAGLRLYFIRRLNKPVLVDKTTGFILEAEALEIESGALAIMRSLLLAKPKASAVMFTLNRTDNLLSTKTMGGQARIVPLAYPETITLDVGFFNPALQVQPV